MMEQPLKGGGGQKEFSQYCGMDFSGTSKMIECTYQSIQQITYNTWLIAET